MDSTTVKTEVIADVSEESVLDTSTGSMDTPALKRVEVVVDYEREEGDGQEYESAEEDGELGSSEEEEEGEDSEEEEEGRVPEKEKKLDDDEDRRNPQYIPKRGTFYEHDDRTAEEESTPQGKEAEAERELEQSTAKKVWKEHENRWGHDMYNEDDQKPKSAEELIELYGYDIRNEEGPPRARRRRRYGRGPNKYTRNWEDEGAYNRPTGPGSVQGDRRVEGNKRNSQTFYSNKVAGRGGGSEVKEAFPALPGADSSASPNVASRENAAWNRKDINLNGANVRVVPPPREEYPKISNNNNRPLQLTPPPPEEMPSRQAAHEHEFRRGSGRGTVSRRGKPFEGALPATARGPGPRGGRTVQGRLSQPSRPDEGGKGDGVTFYKKCQDNHSPKLKTADDLANDLERLDIYPKQQQQEQQQPTREFARQRPDNNKNTVNYVQHHPGVQGSMNVERRQAVVPPRLQQQDTTANRPKRYSSLRQRSLPESGAPQTYAQPPQQQHQYYQTGYVQQPLTQPPPPLQLIQAVHPPTTYATSFPSPPTFIQPAPMMRRPPSPGHYISAAPPPQVLNFVAQPHPAYPPYQGLAAPPDLALYQPQGGITYYSPEEQMMSRALTQRRQRAAIPIVPPPDVHGRGRGRLGDPDTYQEERYSPEESFGENSRPMSREGKYDDADALTYEETN